MPQTAGGPQEAAASLRAMPTRLAVGREGKSPRPWNHHGYAPGTIGSPASAAAELGIIDWVNASSPQESLGTYASPFTYSSIQTPKRALRFPFLPKQHGALQAGFRTVGAGVCHILDTFKQVP